MHSTYVPVAQAQMSEAAQRQFAVATKKLERLGRQYAKHVLAISQTRHEDWSLTDKCGC